MVWMPGHTGRFLDAIGGERLYALFCLVMFCGLRRDEVIGLAWQEADLDHRSVLVRETGGGDGPKSEHGFRVVPLPDVVVAALRAWRKAQLAETALRGAEAWTDTGCRVFAREDGTQCRASGCRCGSRHSLTGPGCRPSGVQRSSGTAPAVPAEGGRGGHQAHPAILGHSRTSFTDATYATASRTTRRGGHMRPCRGRRRQGRRRHSNASARKRRRRQPNGHYAINWRTRALISLPCQRESSTSPPTSSCSVKQAPLPGTSPGRKLSGGNKPHGPQIPHGSPVIPGPDGKHWQMWDR
jgi:hypothetical protein